MRVRLPAGLATRVVRIEVTLSDRSCAEQSASRVVGVVRTVEGGRESGLAALGTTMAGSASVVARGFDASCAVVAYGCTDVRLEDGGSGEIVVPLAAEAGPACEGRCDSGGDCLPFDGTPAHDSGPPSDGSADSGDSGGALDSAGIDGALDTGPGALDSASPPDLGADASDLGPPLDARPDARDAGSPADAAADVRDLGSDTGGARDAGADAALPCPSGECRDGVACAPLGDRCVDSAGDCTTPAAADVECSSCGDGRACTARGDDGTCREGACCTRCWDPVSHGCVGESGFGALCGRGGVTCVRCGASEACVFGMCR